MKLKITLIATLLSIGFTLKAQEAEKNSKTEDEKPQRIFGVGIKLFNLISESFESPSVMPGSKFIFTINPHKNFRIQPEIGYARTKVYNKNLKENIFDKSLTIGGGMFGMWRKEKTNLYAGAKATFNKSSYDNVETNSTYNPNPPYNTIYTYKKQTTIVKNIGFGVVLGGEYFFSRHFSLGAEVSAQRMKVNRDYPVSQNSYNNQEDIISYNFFTESNLLVRFYF